jgi:hypothetical protein
MENHCIKQGLSSGMSSQWVTPNCHCFPLNFAQTIHAVLLLKLFVASGHICFLFPWASSGTKWDDVTDYINTSTYYRFCHIKIRRLCKAGNSSKSETWRWNGFDIDYNTEQWENMVYTKPKKSNTVPFFQGYVLVNSFRDLHWWL